MHARYGRCSAALLVCSASCKSRSTAGLVAISLMAERACRKMIQSERQRQRRDLKGREEMTARDQEGVG